MGDRYEAGGPRILLYDVEGAGELLIFGKLAKSVKYTKLSVESRKQFAKKIWK